MSRPAYDNDSFPYVTKEAESEQPVGVLFDQWVGCRDHAGITYFPHSGRLREDQLIYVESRENMFFYDMGPLMMDFMS